MCVWGGGVDVNIVTYMIIIPCLPLPSTHTYVLYSRNTLYCVKIQTQKRVLGAYSSRDTLTALMEELLDGHLLRVEHESGHIIVVCSVLLEVTVARTEEVASLVHKRLVALCKNKIQHDQL